MTSTKPTVYQTRRLPAEVESALSALGEVQHPPGFRPPTADDLRTALRKSDAILCTVIDRFSATLLRTSGRRAGLLANFGVGVDNIDLETARSVGIRVSNTPGVLTEATAELTIALILAVLRRLGEGERLVRSGGWTGWEPTQLLGRSAHGLRLGVIGMGRIGTTVARRAHAGLGMRILYASRSPVAPWDLGGVEARKVPLDTLLSESDVVTLHVPSTPDTHHLIDARRLALMPPSSVLINTARGNIVDEAALVAALSSGRLAGAGLDVYADEPKVPEPLRTMEQVVLLPHLGSATLETRTAMGMLALANLRAWFEGGTLPTPVV